MRDFIIYTDSGCDLPFGILRDNSIAHSSLTFRFDNGDEEYSNFDMSAADFYGRMRGGGIAKTAAVNSEEFMRGFRRVLDQDMDILYLGFSSGLSSTFCSATVAAEKLKCEYPNCEILTVDTKAASLGLGLIINLVFDHKKSGKSIYECRDYAEEIKEGICHWFTVDDLVYLKRGGRISPTSAFFGNMLGIKPVLHMDDQGHLINVSKARGRRGSINALVEKFGELACDLASDKVFISHGDCESDAKLLAKLLMEKYGASVKLISDVGPVIGAHSGPGTLALFFVGKHR